MRRRQRIIPIIKKERVLEYVAIVSVLLLLQVFWFAFQVGQARVKHGVKAPAMNGPPEFERANRAHQNTVEQLIVFLPGMWMFAYFGNPLVAAGCGAVFLVGRQIYRASYVRDPSQRSAGFGIGALATGVVVIGTLVAAIRDLL